MNAAHKHLILNHISLFALVIGVFVLAASIKRKSTDLRVLATVLFVIAGAFGWITMETGAKAADIVKSLGGPEGLIHDHALAAMWAERSGFFVAGLALVMEWSACEKKKWAKVMQWVLLVAAIHGCTVFARTAYLGGFIRHTEIR